jgi:rubrerythrin
MDIRKIFEYALAREYEGKSFFEQNADRLNHAAAVDAFKRLVAEEQKHIDYIQIQLDALERNEPADYQAGIEMENAGFFTARADSESLDQTIVESMIPDLPVLRLAYLIERDFAEFYEMAAQKASGQAQQVLKILANWERRHEALFKEFHDRAFEQYAQMPWGG